VTRPVHLLARLGPLPHFRRWKRPRDQGVPQISQQAQVNAAIEVASEQWPHVLHLIQRGGDVEPFFGALRERGERFPVFLAVLPTVDEQERLARIESPALPLVARRDHDRSLERVAEYGGHVQRGAKRRVLLMRQGYVLEKNATTDRAHIAAVVIGQAGMVAQEIHEVVFEDLLDLQRQRVDVDRLQFEQSGAPARQVRALGRETYGR